MTKPTKPRSKSAALQLRQPGALVASHDFATLVERVVKIIEEARTRVIRTVNSEMVLSYWHIGREIVEYVQHGEERAEYGADVINDLSVQLLGRIGSGYSARNLWYFRDFYLTYRERLPSIQSDEFRTRLVQNSKQRSTGIPHKAGAESHQGFSNRLSWSHYRTLLKVADPAARSFYEIEAARENWSVPHLERQIHTQLHLRLLKSRDKKGVMELARKGQTVEKPIDLMKSPVVLDFLDLPHNERLRETDLETAIIGRLSQFLLELGKGFAFVARQKRITFEDEDFFVDLVFYNTILKCYLLVDLKLGKLTHQDVGQMDSYMRLFDDQGRTEGDSPTIGLILCAEKNEAMARYSILKEHRQLFAAKYLTWLPSEEELRREIERERRSLEAHLPERPVRRTAAQRKTKK